MDSSARILIVDDFPMIRTMLRRSLNGLGYRKIEEANDGLEAWEMLERALISGDLYELIFLDWNMPRMTGIELIEKCKAIPELSNIPTIIISAERERHNVVRAMKAGANDYILKPFSPEVLSDKLNALLKQKNVLPKASGERT